MDARDKRRHGNGEVLQPHRNALKNPQPASARGLIDFPNLSGDISDISTCPNGTMLLKKFFDAGTVADDRELIFGVCSCFATLRANELI
jgi:hypothetical protein